MPTLEEIKTALQKPEVAVEAAPAEVKPKPAADPVFDGGKSYGQVEGLAGIKYQQAGAYFNSLRQFVRKE